MTPEEFLKQKNILVVEGDYWVCHDLNKNIRTIDIRELLLEYHEGEVKKLNKSNVRSSFPCRFCNAKFTDEYDLEGHVNYYHNQFSARE